MRAHTTAGDTFTAPAMQIDIGGRQFVPPLAVGFGAWASLPVNSGSNNIQVSRINAGSIPTKMIELHSAVRGFSHQQAIGNSMAVARNVFCYTEKAIARRVNKGGPKPTVIDASDVNLAPKPSDCLWRERGQAQGFHNVIVARMGLGVNI